MLLIEYLKNSEAAAYMWCDSEDLSIIADIYQINIKIITTKGRNDKNPTVNWISPESTMKEYAELKDIEMEEMVLLHQKDSHFDLIVSKDSLLATVGSLSLQSNIGPMKDKNEGENAKHVDEEENEHMEDKHNNDEEVSNIDAKHHDEETNNDVETKHVE